MRLAKASALINTTWQRLIRVAWVPSIHTIVVKNLHFLIQTQLWSILWTLLYCWNLYPTVDEVVIGFIPCLPSSLVKRPGSLLHVLLVSLQTTNDRGNGQKRSDLRGISSSSTSRRYLSFSNPAVSLGQTTNLACALGTIQIKGIYMPL